MNHAIVMAQLSGRLSTRAGWERHPERDHHYQHLETGVHILVYLDSVAVTFGRSGDHHLDRAVSASTRFYPLLAICSILEVADALVCGRQRAAAGAD